MSGYRTGTTPVRGGELAHGAWGGVGPLVVAIHGITANHLAFALLAERLTPQFRLVAPDLRGRGRSRDLPPPYGMESHAADVAALVEAEGDGHPAVVVGHSMGGWVAVALARSHPELVHALVLVDGGAPLPLPDGLGADPDDAAIDAAITATVGPAYERLRNTYPSRDAYLDLFRAHPALQEWSPAIEAYVEYDLVGEPPQLRSACRLEAALADARGLYAVGDTAPEPTAVPSVFLRAERGMLDQPEGMYAAGWPEQWLPGTPVETVPDVNHYTVVMGERGADVVAQHVRHLGGAE